MVASLAGVAGHGVAVDADEPLGLADPAALGDVFQHGRGLLRGQVGMEQWGALAFGKPMATGPTAEEANRVVFPIMSADREIFSAPETLIGALRIQAAEAREVIHGPPPTTYHAPGASGCDTMSG